MPVSVTVGNSIFSQTYSTMVQLASCISVTEILSIDTAVLKNSLQQFQVNFESLGEPSCAKVYTNSRTQSIGSDLATCAKYFPRISYTGNYNVLNGSWIFDMTMDKIGYTNVRVNIANSLDSITLSTYVNVVAKSVDCQNPELSMTNQKPLFYDPAIETVSDLVSIKVATILVCNATLINTKKWTIYRVDQVTGQITGSVNINENNNPTVNYAELVLSPKSLKQGLYKFVYQVTMGVTTQVFSSKIETYVKMISSGIVISALGVNQINVGGTYEISRGVDQKIRFDPIAKSYDKDDELSMSSLSYLYYCQVIESGIEMGYPKMNANQYMDLKTLQSVSAENISFVPCFDSQGNH